MVIPWLGVPLASILDKVGVQPGAKYVAFRTLEDATQMPGQRARIIDWPYREGLRLDEAMHPLTIMATGLYAGTTLPDNGRPVLLLDVQGLVAAAAIDATEAGRNHDQIVAAEAQANAARNAAQLLLFRDTNGRVRGVRAPSTVVWWSLGTVAAVFFVVRNLPWFPYLASGA